MALKALLMDQRLADLLRRTYEGEVFGAELFEQLAAAPSRIRTAASASSTRNSSRSRHARQRPGLGVPGHQVGDVRLIGGRPPRAVCRRRWL
jgi:hypothetical protein